MSSPQANVSSTNPPPEERGGVMQAVEAVGTIASGVGGIATTAYVVKHWNDPRPDPPQDSLLPAMPTAPPDAGGKR